MFLQPILLGISGIFSGVLQSVKKFLSYSLAPIFYNVGIIFGILVLVPVLGPVGLAWGVVAGAFLHLAIQYPAARSSGWHWRPSLNIGFEALRRVFVVMVPRSASLIVGQVNLIVLVSLATLLGTGSVAIFNFANDLYSLPLGVIVIPLSVAAFPVFVRKLSEGKDALGDVFLQTLRRLLFLITPLVVLALVLRAQVVRLTLGYGKFVWEDTVLTIETLSFLLLGLLFHAVLALVLRAFFALEDAKTPLVVLVLGMVVTIGSALFFRQSLGVGGLALGMALGMAFNSSILFGILAKKIKLRKLGKLLRAFLSFLLGAIVAGVLARATLFLAVDYLVTTQKVWGLFVQATLATIVGGAVYIFISWLLRLPEIDSLRVKLGLRPPEDVTFEDLPEQKLPR